MSTEAHTDFLIETPRLGLRPFLTGDVDYLVGLLGDRVTMSHWPTPLSEADAAVWLQRSLESYERHGFGRWLVLLKKSDQAIGDVGILRLPIAGQTENDLGYIIHRDHWGHGFGFEAARACAAWARGRDLDSLVANMAVDNTASIRVAERLGMNLERVFNNPRNANKATRLYRLELQQEAVE